MTIRTALILTAFFGLELTLAPLATAAICAACPDTERPGTFPTYFPQVFEGSRVWNDPARSGEGWTFSELKGVAGQPATGIGVTYTYEVNGRPAWLLLQGAWARETNTRRLLEGQPVAVLSGPIFDAEGGGCPTCPWTTPSVAQRRYQQAEVIFHRPDVATVRLDGQVAGSGEARLVPAELNIIRALHDFFAGTWRFTLRFPGSPTTIRERNFLEHGCEVTITPTASPSREHLFEADPASVPFWLPPSGAQVKWFSIAPEIFCANIASVGDARFHIAVDPGSKLPIRAIALAGLQANSVVETIGGVPQSVVLSYRVSRLSRFLEVYVQDSDTMILRLIDNNNPASLSFGREWQLTRAP